MLNLKEKHILNAGNPFSLISIINDLVVFFDLELIV